MQIDPLTLQNKSKNAKQSHKSYFKVEDTNNKAFDLSYHDPYLKFY